MSTITYTFHYTYIIINTTNQMKYIGVRSCSCLPENDSDYMSSSKILIEELQKNPEAFTKTIIDTFPTREIANANEQWLHETYDVARNPEFYNRMNVPLRFCMFGKTGKDSHWYGRKHSEATRKKMSLAQSGEKHSHYGKVPWNKGKQHTAAARKKMSEAQSGEKHHMYGKKRSAATLEKMRKPRGPQKKTTCPHCLQTGGGSMMKRWHFENCREIT